jgi:hypothetical protein
VAWEAWTLIALSFVAGLALKTRGLLVPVVYVVVLYILGDAKGDVVNHSGNGDNLQALALYGAVIWLAIGVAIGLLGWALRVGIDLVYRSWGHPGTPRHSRAP